MRLVSTFSTVLVLGAISGAISGCDTPATQLVVVVDTDFEVNEAMATVQATVLDAEGAPVSSHEFTLADDAVDEPGPARFAMPLSFGVVPVGDDPGRRVTVVVEGIGGAGEVLVRRRAVTGFVAEQTLALPMFLAFSCRLDGGLSCPEGQTCTPGGCRDEVISPGELRVVVPGRELDDAGTPDTGSPPDAGLLHDGGFDGGAECGERVECGATECLCPGDATCCTLDCKEPSCVPNCERNRSCVVEAVRAETVDAECGMASSCYVDARGAGDVRVTCFMGACTVDCSGARDCALDCSVGASCVLKCADSNRCEMRSCTGEVSSCGDDVLACRTECP